MVETSVHPWSCRINWFYRVGQREQSPEGRPWPGGVRPEGSGHMRVFRERTSANWDPGHQEGDTKHWVPAWGHTLQYTNKSIPKSWTKPPSSSQFCLMAATLAVRLPWLTLTSSGSLEELTTGLMKFLSYVLYMYWLPFSQHRGGQFSLIDSEGQIRHLRKLAEAGVATGWCSVRWFR